VTGIRNEDQADSENQIIFDTRSGISLEEQEEILADVNALTRGKRLIPEALLSNATKKGFLFPVLVNAGAIALLAFGLLLLSRVQEHNDQIIRGSSAGLNSTEQLLIQEIREETNRQLGEIEELRKLQSEQELASRAENQMRGFYALVVMQIEQGKFIEAANTLIAMKEFLDTPSFRGNRSLEAGKPSALLTIAAIEAAVMEALFFSGGAIRPSPDEGLREQLADYAAQTAALEEKTVSLERNLASINAQSSNQSRIIAENTAALRQRDTEIQNLDVKNTVLEQQVSVQNSDIAALIAQRDRFQRQTEELQTQIAAIRALLQD
jgi:DNA repair exonuclease SbcCD ATPase subunit